MFSPIIRLIYALTYFCHLAAIGELYQLYTHWSRLSIYWNGVICEGLKEIISIHFPLIILLILWFIFRKTTEYARKHLAPVTIKISKSDLTAIDVIFADKSFLPYITLLTSFVGKSFAAILFPVATIFFWFFLAHYGNFNTMAFVLGYKQYKVSTASASYWLISNKRINNFTSPYTVVEISDSILLRI